MIQDLTILIVLSFLYRSALLGPLHGESSKHDYAPLGITKWTRRRDKLLEEIREMSADIICMQEVSAKGLKETFIPNLKHIGLECFGYAPSKTADKVKGKYGHKHVGCAIFGRSAKFDIVSSKRVHLRDFGGSILELSRSHSFHVDYTGKWNSMAIVMLRIRETNQTVCIANTHLYWNPERADIKAMQTYACMDAINKFCVELGYSKKNQPPLILCGDFNTMPDMGFNELGMQFECYLIFLCNLFYFLISHLPISQSLSGFANLAQLLPINISVESFSLSLIIALLLAFL